MRISFNIQTCHLGIWNESIFQPVLFSPRSRVNGFRTARTTVRFMVRQFMHNVYYSLWCWDMLWGRCEPRSLYAPKTQSAHGCGGVRRCRCRKFRYTTNIHCLADIQVFTINTRSPKHLKAQASSSIVRTEKQHIARNERKRHTARNEKNTKKHLHTFYSSAHECCSPRASRIASFAIALE